MQGWRFWIDRGGTFTDVIGVTPRGEIVVRKVLSEGDGGPDDPGVSAIRQIIGQRKKARMQIGEIGSVRMGTTVGTNALLERKGVRTALLITKGFRDLLRIGYQDRPDLFSLEVALPSMLYEEVVEVDERIGPDGEVLVPLDTSVLKRQLCTLRDKGISSLAIVYLHSVIEPCHEIATQKIAQEMGFDRVSASHSVSQLIKAVPRGDTTVMDAYLSPVLSRYISTVAEQLGKREDDRGLLFMRSSGSMTPASGFRGKDCILSGPAGGILGAIKVAERAGCRRIVSFDMGGTSTDVAHFDGELERTYENTVGGVRIRSPMLRVNTVAAGGGSILKFDMGRFLVGPDSAGADPGPVCYRKGGPLALTDANVLLGRIQPDHFPKVFGGTGDEPIDISLVQDRFRDLCEGIEEKTGTAIAPEQAAEGFLRVAVENMAQAIKVISVQKGVDITDHVLCSFGGAAGQHACRVADSLGMERVLIPGFSGVLSAYGIGTAPIGVLKRKSLEAPLGEGAGEQFGRCLDDLESECERDIGERVSTAGPIRFERKLHLKYLGTDSTIEVREGSRESMIDEFRTGHLNRFGFLQEGREIMVDSVSVEGAYNDQDDLPLMPLPGGKGPRRERSADVFLMGKWIRVPLFIREELPAGFQTPGPAVIVESTGTNIVEPGWSVEVTDEGGLLLSKVVTRVEGSSLSTSRDPVRLEVFNRLFMSVAEQMGYALRNTARSVNMKERLDFSCAVFDGRGGLVSNAPHIPVHLGSMDGCVRSVLERFGGTMEKGDVYMLNSPFSGGTHLPDITVVTPVFLKGGSGPVFFVASRGHHADIGGMRPGSMGSSTITIEEEGAISDGMLIVSDGRFDEEGIRDWLTSCSYPARNPDENIADLKAQVAANERGIGELMRICDRYTIETVLAYMEHVQNNAEETVRELIRELRDGRSEGEMDNGCRIRAVITIDRDMEKAVIDLSGTSEQGSHNFNAPLPVCRSAVLYTFRTLVSKDIPLNQGCMKPLEVKVTRGSLLDPVYPAAVAAGNVETSQYIVDVLLRALGKLAGSQGTMNNISFGNEKVQYYETVCGGTGAGPHFDGTDAVHSHMTNTRITDPEVLEMRYPVILEEFSIRENSGGVGRFKGGCGVKRAMRFREKMQLSILSGHRRVPPEGLKGGENGEVGRNRLLRGSGEVIELGGCAELTVAPGDLLIVETPGGGGFGRPIRPSFCDPHRSSRA